MQDLVEAERQEPAVRPATRIQVAGQEEGDQIDDQRGSSNQPGAGVGPGLVSRPAAVGVEQANEASRLPDDEEEEDEDEEENWGWGRDRRRFGPAWLAVATFVHEAWLLLQHANILLNPLCQRLDRSYGVALVRTRIKSVARLIFPLFSKFRANVVGLCGDASNLNTWRSETSSTPRQRLLAEGALRGLFEGSPEQLWGVTRSLDGFASVNLFNKIGALCDTCACPCRFCLLLQLKRRLYWVIAGVLSAYWAREVLSMVIASPYASPLTLNMVAISSVYHVGKILLISLDARRQWSPTLGIMRLLMDHWHLSSFKEALLCAKRVSLQVGRRGEVVLSGD